MVNGEELRVPVGTTVQDLCTRFRADPRHTAVERNRVIVARAAFGTTVLQDGDVLEIVTLVGGG
ncbi:MAG: sulfur carrier protein ThiS [Planctomycetota bacterium]